MKKPPTTIPPAGMRSWQEIGQSAVGRALSPVAWRKRFVRALGWSATTFLVLGMAALALWGAWIVQQSQKPGRAPSDKSPLQHVEFFSKGVLTEDWVRNYLHLQDGEPLQNYDVFALRERLIQSKQVSDAVVERILPSTLRITVTERKPWLRLAVDDGAGSYKTLLVARDGTVFEGQLYGDEALRQMPWVAGVTLHHDANGGYLPLPGMDAVVGLLTAARADIPQLAAQWTVVDLSGYDLRPQAPISLIKITSRDLGEVDFLAGDFHKQIDRLAIIARTLQERRALSRRIDLSLDNQVVVQLVSLQPTASTFSHHSVIR